MLIDPSHVQGVYVVGGSCWSSSDGKVQLTSTEYYDAKANSWLPGPSLQHPLEDSLGDNVGFSHAGKPCMLTQDEASGSYVIDELQGEVWERRHLPVTCRPYASSYSPKHVVGNKLFYLTEFDIEVGDLESNFLTLDLDSFVVQALPKPPLPSEMDVAITSSGTSVFLIGGADASDEVPSAHDGVQVWCTQSEQWAELPKMLTARCGAAAVWLDGLLYVTGGSPIECASCFETDDWLKSVEVFNPDTQTWSGLSPMKHAQAGHIATVLGGRIFVFGMDSTNTSAGKVVVQMYDPPNGSWTELSTSEVERRRPAIITGV